MLLTCTFSSCAVLVASVITLFSASAHPFKVVFLNATPSALFSDTQYYYVVYRKALVVYDSNFTEVRWVSLAPCGRSTFVAYGSAILVVGMRSTCLYNTTSGILKIVSGNYTAVVNSYLVRLVNGTIELVDVNKPWLSFTYPVGPARTVLACGDKLAIVGNSVKVYSVKSGALYELTTLPKGKVKFSPNCSEVAVFDGSKVYVWRKGRELSVSAPWAADFFVVADNLYLVNKYGVVFIYHLR